ncbi:MAG: DUF4382 domain-containing protein [Armatimonadota bacterium]
MKTKAAMCVLAAVAVVGLMIFAGCSGDSDNPVPTTPVRVMLVDAPAHQIEELHVHFDSVELVRSSAPVQVILDENQLPDDVDVIAAGETPVILGTPNVPVGTYTWSNLGINGDSPVNRVVTQGGVSEPVQYVRPTASTANLARRYQLQAGADVTLLFNFAAAASLRETSEGWVLRPQVFSRFVEGEPTFGELSGVVSEVGGGAPAIPPGGRLGVFLRTESRNELVDIAEVDPATGAFRMPSVLTGSYRVIVQLADLAWGPIGEPLFEDRDVRVGADQVTNLDIEVDL